MNIFKTLAAFIISVFYSSLSYGQAQLAYANENVKLTDSTHKEIMVLPKGEALYLPSLENVNGTYRVQLLKNGKTGFLKIHDLKVERPLPEGQTFDQLKSKERDPIVRVHNSSKIPMSLKLAKKDYTLYPGNTLNVRLPKGKQYYYISSSKSEYHYGKEVLDEYRIYEWEFYVDDVK